MKETTLCYLEKDGQFLMLLRNKKKQDPNEGKWIGVGGKLEPGETPEQCVVREVQEETGLVLTSFESRGRILFLSDQWEDEIMYLFTASEFQGELTGECNEGDLKWIPFQEIPSLNLWEGDRLFLEKLIQNREPVYMTLRYQGENLVSWEET